MFGNRTIVHARTGNGNIAPVPFGAKVGEPDLGVVDRRRGIPVTRFDQKDVAIGPGGQRARQRATCTEVPLDL
jgi:hypothetical protein